MAIKIQNLRITPYSSKDTLKVVFGDEMELTFTLPHVEGESFLCGLDSERVVYPPSRPICAYTNTYTRDGDDVTFKLKLTTSRLRDYVSHIRKPMPVWLQVVRVVNGKYETVLLDDILALPSVIDGAMTVCEGDPLGELLDGKMDKPYAEGVDGQVLTMGADGHYAWADLPEIPEQEQADWEQSDSTAVSYIQNKPDLKPVATSGSYTDLTDKPDLTVYVEKEDGKGLSTNDYTDADKEKLGGIEDGAEVNVQADYDESDSNADSYVRHKPAISAVGHTGSYADLLNKPDLSVYSLITETGNKISMSIDEEYDLVVNLLDKNDNILSTQDIDLPIESMIVDATYANGVLTLTLQNGNTVDVDISDIVSGLVPDSRTVNGHALSSDVTVTATDLGLATVATSGSYDDLIDKPVQKNADWDESDSSDPAYIQNKPTIPAPQVQSDWDESDSTAVSFILNKPTIPVVNDATVTINQGGVEKGTFTLNQSGNATVNLNDGAQSDWDESDSTAVSYILNKPSIPAPQVQADWDESDSTDVSYIQNKPTAYDMQANFLETDNTKPSYISGRGMNFIQKTDVNGTTYILMAGMPRISVLNMVGNLILSGAWITNDLIEYLEVVIDWTNTSATLTPQGSLTFVDTPTPGKRNICIVRWQDGVSKLYVVATEDLDDSSSN